MAAVQPISRRSVRDHDWSPAVDPRAGPEGDPIDPVSRRLVNESTSRAASDPFCFRRSTHKGSIGSLLKYIPPSDPFSKGITSVDLL
jgi:hypothetical protein